MNENLGISGRTAKKFLGTEITPLLAILGLLLGVFAVLITPKEEEPQINVTFANIFIPFPGASVAEVEQLVSTPAEQVLSEIAGIEHVYSVSQPGMSILTVQYEVGQDRTQSIVRLYNKILSNQDWLPQNLGVGQPVIKPKGIDDVPIVTLTLWSEDDSKAAYDLQHIAHSIEVELKRVPGTRDIYTVGSVDQVMRVRPDINRLAGYGISLAQLRQAITLNNRVAALANQVLDDQEIQVQSGRYLANVSELQNLIISVHDGKPVQVSDVAQVSYGPDQPNRYVMHRNGAAAGSDVDITHPAVTIAIAKKPGANAVEIADNLIKRVEQLKGRFIPADVHVEVTRNYGETADAKANKLIGKLVFATAFVVLLVLLALGRREALIVGVAVVITLAVTLFASWAYGFSINRVSLFALIFSIGILVDDAIVVVENIHRHMQSGQTNLMQAIPLAVDEVGGPTILATFTVIAALLPMAFVTGLMGPYMSPIPINASMGMLISLAVAFSITPWLAQKFLKVHTEHHTAEQENSREQKLYRLFDVGMRRFLRGEKGRANRWWLLLGVLGLILLSVALPVFKLVVLKMLPFDNKSEFQVVVDMPEGSSLEQTAMVISELADVVARVPEVKNLQSYVGTAAPINFNGLVRQYYLRSQANQADLQVNLVDKHDRDKKSHEVASEIRPKLTAIGEKYHANVKVVEVPPGPPVLAPIVAEIYGPDNTEQIRIASQLEKIFNTTQDVVDVDSSVQAPAKKWLLQVDRQKAALLQVDQANIVQTLGIALNGDDSSYMHDNYKYPTPIRIELSEGDKADLERLLQLKVNTHDGKQLALSEVVSFHESEREQAIYHKDLLPVTMVTGDLSGNLDSPLYGMFDISATLRKDNGMEQYFFSRPEDPYTSSLKWDGEWQVTYETFRDMGIAYGVGMILIYLLVVAQFRSYLVPLIIMSPIPLTIIGVMPGHALLGAQFTATSMIGMIALAGIIVRNSILLIDFIQEQVAAGVELEEAVIKSGAVRATPIVLTGLAAMLGALFILDDPIFSGLAIALIFGVLVSTLLTLFIIPVMYYAFRYK